MEKITWSQKLHYEFDNLMAKGVVSQIGGLAIGTLAILVIASACLIFFQLIPVEGNTQLSFLDLIWITFLHALDPGTLAGDQGSIGFLSVMFVVTMGGIFVLSTLIGILSNALSTRLEELQKGRSFVAEQDHVLILGTSSKIFPIIQQLVIANENQGRSCITILTEDDPVFWLDEVKENVGQMGRTRIVVRAGSPLDLLDLELVHIDGAKSIIIPSPEIEDPDAYTFKIVLAILNNPKRRERPYHIVVELEEQKSVDLINMVGQDEVEMVQTNDIIARLIAQTCLQPGLSVVYNEIFDFEGDEIYFHDDSGFIGQPFGQVLLQYETACPIGVFTSENEVLLNPDVDRMINPGEQIIAVAEDDHDLRRGRVPEDVVTEHLIQTKVHPKPEVDRTLILGWNHQIFQIIDELNQYVPPNSELFILADEPNGVQYLSTFIERVTNQEIVFQQGDTTDRKTLNSINIPRFDQVIVLCYSDALSTEKADTKTMITLLHLRNIIEKSDEHFTVVSEMLDIGNRELAAVTQANDFIVSDNLLSRIMAQLAENKRLGIVFEQLFSAEGTEIYLRLAGDYVTLGEPVNFYTVVASAIRRGEVAFGYRLAHLARDAKQRFGVVLNPVKSEPVIFVAEDRIIILAED